MDPHASGGFPLGLTISISPFWWIGGWRNGYGRASACDRSVVFGEGVVGSRVRLAFANGTGEPRPAGVHLVDLSREAVALCDRASHRGDAPDSRAMFATGAQVRRHGGPRRQSASRARADHHQPSAPFLRRSGLPQAEGFWLSARSVDDPAAGRARARAGCGCRIRLSGPSRPGNFVQILAAPEVKPHKLRYYLERRDPDFDAKMAEVVSVYREVEQLKQAAKARSEETPAPTPAVAIISYDEKPGIQALANKAPDLPPKPMRHRTVARDHEYVRLGTQSLLAGIDLMTGVVHASVERRHRSREFVKFLKKLDAAHPPATAIKLILDNHSAHKSKETMAWLAQQPKGRFTLVYTPKHGSWLNLVEGFFSKLARSVLRHIRVASLPELGQRILAEIDRINRRPVVHTWKWRIAEAK